MKTILSLICLVSFATLLNAQKAGTLDLSFGDSGKVLSTTATGLPSPANAVIVKSNGKILAGSGEYINEKNIFLQKQFLTNGTPDSSFGKNGEVTTDFGNGVRGSITAMAVTSDNKIITTGIGGLDASNPRGADVLLAQYDDRGNLDPDFGTNGLVIVDFGLFEYANCMKLTRDNKILVGGACRKTINFSTKNNFLLVRFNTDGSIDSSFGDKGKVITDVGLTYGSDINAIAITADGSIIAAGKAENLSGSINDEILLGKYTADGKRITDFGVNGFVFTNPSEGQDYATAVAMQDDGKIVAAGVTGAYSKQAGMCIVRYNENGNPDSSFNKTGVRIIYFGKDNSWAQALLIQKDKSFLLGGGKYQNNSGSADDFALASVTTDGNLNSAFEDEGTVTTDFSGFSDYCNAIALQADGKIVAAGGSSDSLGTIAYISLARYNNNNDESKKQKIISKIKHYIQNHNNLESNSTADAKAATLNISIAPNPVSSMLTIKGLSTNTKHTVRITNESGNTVANKQIADVSSYQINVQALSAGVYYVNIISNNNQSTTLKFIKQ